MSLTVFLGPQNAPKSPQTLLSEVTALPRHIAGIKGPMLRPLLLRGKGKREGKKREKGRQNDLCYRTQETLAPPLAHSGFQCRVTDQGIRERSPQKLKIFNVCTANWSGKFATVHLLIQQTTPITGWVAQTCTVVTDAPLWIGKLRNSTPRKIKTH